MSSSEVPLRVAAVSYLNARPLVEPLRDHPAVRLTCGLPRDVARMLAEDEADVALMPVAAAAEQGDVRLLPGMAIGARGPVRSVLLVSERPVHELDEVCLDLSSRTSLVLARLILARYKLSPRLLGFPSSRALAEVRGSRGAVVIGDPALDAGARFPCVIDLAGAWYAWTGLPFVFAAWCHRPGALAPEHHRLLLDAKEVGLGMRRSLAEEHARKTGRSAGELERYLTEHLSYALGDDEERGLRRFFDEGHAAGLLPRGDDVVVAAPRGPAPRGSTLDAVLARAAEGERLSGSDAERLLAGASVFELGIAADASRRRRHPAGVVTYIVDRNVNYTNVCTTSCRFCAFYRPVGHAEGYVLDREVLGRKLDEVVRAGGVQILLQGGLNPELGLDWYEDLFRWMKSGWPLGLHALSPEEVLFIARNASLDVERVLERLHAAGLDSVPGGGAEILVDRVRRRIAKAKCTSEEWLGVMRAAHHMGLRSSATMMYGTVDTPRDRVLHLLKLRDLQDETRGFTAFFCWDFQYEQGVRVAPKDTGTLVYLRTQALARLVLDNFDHVGASWVTQGPAVGQVALRFGADDFGSVMFEENVVSSAGTSFRMDAGTMESRIHEAGFLAARRDVRYTHLTEPA